MAAANDIVALVADDLIGPFLKERKRLDRIDKWARWDHDKPHTPRRQSTAEYRELVARSQVPYLRLVVNAIVQGLYVDGYRRDDATNPTNQDATPWHYWQVNRMDKRQIAIHRAALTYGVAYETVLPGVTHLDEQVPVMRGHSPRRMMAFYADDEPDFPEYAIQADPASSLRRAGWRLKVYDATAVYTLKCDPGGGGIEYVGEEVHDVGVCPVVRFSNPDLEDRSDGEVEPLIPLQGRIDQTIFDRLVVQRFTSWVVRTIAGMEVPPGAKDAKNPTAEELAAHKVVLTVADILVAADPDTKFGSLPATDLGGFISAHEADLKDLIASSQTAPHYLLGQLVNLSAEALAAAETGAARKKLEIQTSFGESHEETLRLGGFVMGDVAAAGDTEAQVRWRDTDSRSLAQVADAITKLVTAGVPIEVLLELMPKWSQQDVEHVVNLIKHETGVQTLIQQLKPESAPAPVPVPAV